MEVETQLLAFLLTLAVASLLYLLRVLDKREDDYAEDIAQLRHQSEELLLESKFWRQKSTDADAEIEDFRVVVDKFKAVVLTQEEEIKKQKGRAQSAHTSKGQILEKWTPFLSTKDIDDHWRVEDWAFLGSPIDYIVFDWHENKTLNDAEGKVVLLDVKAAKSQLTTKQRRIRDLVQKGQVEWREIRLD